jgi:hypothetical protein
MTTRLLASAAFAAAIVSVAACGGSSSTGAGGSSSTGTTTTSGTAGGGTGAGEPGPCNDGMKGSGETDVDCGGTCPRCDDGKACKGSGDCVSNTCIGELCAQPACDDKVKDGKETDVDCGGSCSTACADGQSCKVGGDCASGVCTAFVCQGSSCKDGAKNGSETGVDCGGSCPRCPDGQPCTMSGDCQSTLCEAMSCASNLVWSKAFGDASAQVVSGVAADAQGNVLVIGTFTGTIDLGSGPLVSAGGTDIFLAKLDPTGNAVWSKRFGDAADQVGGAVAVDPGGSSYITGSVKGTVDFGLGPLSNAGDPLTDTFVAGFSPSGTAMFSKRYAATFAQAGTAIAVNAAQEILLGGTFGSSADFGCGVLPGAGGTDVFLAKLSSLGACVWSKRFGDAADQDVASVAFDGSGNVLAGGRFSGAIGFGGPIFTMNGAVHGGFVVKLDPLGAHLFSSSLGNVNSDQAVQGVTTDPSGNIVISGVFTGNVDVGAAPLASAGQGDLFVIKLDPGGSHVWSKALGDASDQAGRALVATDGNGAVLVAGHFQGTLDFGLGQLQSAGQTDLFTAKLDADGNALWSKRYGDAGAQELGGLAHLGETGAAIGGNFQGTLDLGGALLTSKGSTDGFAARLTTP